MAYDFDHYPPSPTLTNPDMILPSAFDSSSPTKSISKRLSAATNLAISELAKFHQSVPISPAPTSPSILVRNSSPLEAISEADTTPRRTFYHAENTLASSPTLRILGKPVEWPLNATARRLSATSNGSSSVHSEDIENWTPTHSTNDAEESAVEDDEEKFGQFAKQTDGEGNVEDGAGTGPREDDDDFLSRRAEIILANAKKRLNLMEGNLKGARHSLSSTGLSSRYSYSSRVRQAYLLGSQSTPGHSRAASEASVPSPVPSVPVLPRPLMLPKRSSSALGSFAGGLTVLDRSASLRGARSQEAMRESRLKNWIMDDRRASSSVDVGRSASSTGHHYAARESPTPSEIRRPGSQASEIRAQMNELKDRISEIKERAKENNKRNSTLSLKSSSSPGSSDRNTPTEPYKFPAASSGTGTPTQKGVSPLASPVSQDFAVKKLPKQYVPSQNGIDEVDEYAESNYVDAEETLDDLENELNRNEHYSQHYAHESILGDVLDELPEEEEELNEMDEEADDEEEEVDSVSGHTEYYDIEPVVVAERHEDRADAFDYENFFLHSAMGTYSRNQRRDSFSSESSVETTRPVSPLRTADSLDPENPDDRVTGDEDDINGNATLVHGRNMSMQSMSTLASFHSAENGVEEQDEEEEGEEDDDYYDDLDAAVKFVGTAQPVLYPRKSLSPRKHPGPSPLSPLPDPPSLPFPSMSSRELKASFTELFNFFLTHETVGTGASEAFQRDRALVENVVVSLQKCCIEMQQASNGRRIGLRDRLVVAKRVLEGSDSDGEEGL